MNKQLQPFKLSLFERIKLSIGLIIFPKNSIINQLSSLITIDDETHMIKFNGDIVFKTTGNLILDSDKHICLASGFHDGNYDYFIHFNPEEKNYDRHELDKPGCSGQRSLQSDDCHDCIGVDAVDGELDVSGTESKHDTTGEC